MTLLEKRRSGFHPGKTERGFKKIKLSHSAPLFTHSVLVLSYPYSEDYTQPTQYMNTRCPAWCDRVLMSHAAHDCIHRVSRK